MRGFTAAAGAARAEGIELIPGIEISAVQDGRDLHVLGYFIDPDAPALKGFLLHQRDDRLRRVHEMRARLAALGCPIDVDPILDAAARGKSVGRPQIAAALLAAGHVRTIDEAFDRFLESGAPASVPRVGAPPAEVIRIVHDAGGLASLAHPGLGRHDELIPALVAAGLDALEARHSEHDAATEAKYRALAGQLGLLVTGGSDYHGDAAHGAAALGSATLPSADYDRLRSAAGRRRLAH
jgi:predicted metal-dependent phosphoesterase TrpH